MDPTAPSTPRVPFRLVLASIAGVWLAYFALTTLGSNCLTPCCCVAAW